MSDSHLDDESGSLLEQALNHESHLVNTVIVDVFILTPPPQHMPSIAEDVDHLLALAKLAVALNQYTLAQSYPWISGGDGPVFGAHTTGGIAHLRASHHYAASVADEWFLIGLVMQFTLNYHDKNIVASCWDCDDGQVLLVQSAHELPTWVDDVGPENCLHRCWIRNGGVHLNPPRAMKTHASKNATKLSLSEALSSLRSSSTSLYDSNVSAVIQETVRRTQTNSRFHTSAVALPRSAANLFYHRPDLIGAAAYAFQYHVNEQSPLPNEDASTLLAGTCHDWIVITIPVGRTHYAMLRTLEYSPHWMAKAPAIDSATNYSNVPPIYSSIEVKRLNQTMQTAEHLHHAVPLGVKLVIGLEYLLKLPDAARSLTVSMTERRILQHWVQIARDCGSGKTDHGNDNDAGKWIQEAWTAGPNRSDHNLEHLCKCLVFEKELMSEDLLFHQPLTPVSHPETSVPTQIRKELHSAERLKIGDSLPCASKVDADDWLKFPNDDELQLMTEPVSATRALDTMRQGVTSLLKGQIEGSGNETRQHIHPQLPATSISPDVALGLLHMTLKAKKLDDIQCPRSSEYAVDDAYFTKEDFDMEAAIGKENGGNGSDKEDD
ncbi:hypothetical protein MPSEU_000151100 [Mayamaea pseudoterrestris]|nr:hypothetical protein MPSEU_000151100 [Mayamaea pseudoterrestris]